MSGGGRGEWGKREVEGEKGEKERRGGGSVQGGGEGVQKESTQE